MFAPAVEVNRVDPFTIKRTEAVLNGYIEAKVPRNVQTSVRLTYEWEGSRLTLTEERPAFPFPGWRRSDIAQFRLEDGKWSVYARDEGGCWRPVESIAPYEDFESQLEKVEIDREGVFWIS